MKDFELFQMIKDAEYVKCGLCANYNLTVKDETIYVLFEESNGNWDWFFNLLYKLPIAVRPYKKATSKHLVHIGIKIVWHMMRDELMGKLKELVTCYPSYKIVVAGWSHGGGQADMCAEDINYQLDISPTVKTFGGLRIAGNKKTAKYYRSCYAEDSVKYENGSDFVPRLPFAFMGFKDIMKTHIGDKFSWFKFYKVAKYHTAYGDESLYEEE